MERLWDLLFSLSPAIIVFLTTFYMLKQYFQQKEKEQNMDAKTRNQSVVLPLKLQAYERIVIFLERISPDSLVMRLQKTTPSGRELHALLLATIRQEFEHNMSQQIYISSEAWVKVKWSKEEMVKLINLAASRVDDNASSAVFAQAVFTTAGSLKSLPTTETIYFLKQEIGRIL